MRLHYLQEDSLVELYEGNIRRITDLKYIENKQRGKFIYKIIYSGFSFLPYALRSNSLLCRPDKEQFNRRRSINRC